MAKPKEPEPLTGVPALEQSGKLMLLYGTYIALAPEMQCKSEDECYIMCQPKSCWLYAGHHGPHLSVEAWDHA